MIEYPPSTGIAVPVTKSDAGELRNTAMPAKSAIAPHRAAGVRASTRSCRPSISRRARLRRFADIDAGVVDENVDPAELTLDALDHGGDGGLVGDVGDDGHRLAAALFELGDCRDRFRFIASDDGNRGAGLRQPACHAEPDATIAAGDDRDLAAEIK